MPRSHVVHGFLFPHGRSDEAVTVSPFVHAAKLRGFLHDLMPPVFPQPQELSGFARRARSTFCGANDKDGPESLKALWGVKDILRPASMTKFDISSFSKVGGPLLLQNATGSRLAIAGMRADRAALVSV